MRETLVAIALLAGCHSAGLSADQACTDLANARCAQLQSCSPAVISSIYGDLATCQAREKLSCTPSLIAPSTSATPAQYDKCATALAASSCSSLFARNPPADCLPQPGKRADGAACGDDAQCASTYCKKMGSSVCGVCGTRAPAGAACSIDDNCDFQLACANAMCVPYGDLGAACDVAHPCAAPNLCISGACVAPMGAGMTCDRFAQNCDQTQALYCNVQSVCAARTFAAPGESCDAAVECGAGGRCAASGNTLRGTCLAPVPDGAPCNPGMNNRPDCERPALCVGINGAMDGICTLPDPASCG